jgi:hypothetical protein
MISKRRRIFIKYEIKPNVGLFNVSAMFGVVLKQYTELIFISLETAIKLEPPVEARWRYDSINFMAFLLLLFASRAGVMAGTYPVGLGSPSLVAVQ